MSGNVLAEFSSDGVHYDYLTTFVYFNNHHASSSSQTIHYISTSDAAFVPTPTVKLFVLH